MATDHALLDLLVMRLLGGVNILFLGTHDLTKVLVLEWLAVA